MAKRCFQMGSPFKRDLKKHYMTLVDEAWTEVANCLLNAKTLPEKYQDHPLKGDKHGLRDCHIKPDLVLIYRINDDIVELHRLATHSELF